MLSFQICRMIFTPAALLCSIWSLGDEAHIQQALLFV